MEASIVFPHQLFEDNPVLEKDRLIYLVEDPRFFTDFTFHKQKLILHRATMRMYYNWLKRKKYKVKYIELNDAKKLFTQLKKEKVKTIHVNNPVDHVIEKKLDTDAKKAKIELVYYETPMFLSSLEWIDKHFKNKKSYLMHNFYVAQRKHLNILLTKQGKPVGGKWSYDTENREPIKDNIKIPKIYNPRKNKYVTEAQKYIKKHFAKNYGEPNFNYPTTFDTAKKWFKDFLKKRFKNFGTYQDAIVADKHFLFHSVLTPVLNIGLLTPEYVVDETLKYAKKHSIPINSLEGFIRQVIGWREFVRAVYYHEGKKQAKSNFFKHRKKLPKSFWDASTDIEPIDNTITKVLETAYAHHIERLMILGNFMLLCEFKPGDVYTWFMELFIDAYDWVMVPNVYGMSQYADGGTMTTKPYVSSSNYVLKMSDYKKNEWNTIWDALYWHFMYTKRNILNKNPRMKFSYNLLKKMKKETLKEHMQVAKKFLKLLK